MTARNPPGRNRERTVRTSSAAADKIVLLKPTPGARATLHSALKRRMTLRSISDRALPPQVLSNLLWSACGVNRRSGPFGSPGRTAASASNAQEIDLYVALEQGVYRYEPVPHALRLVAAEDVRDLAIGAGQGRAGSAAPVRFIYVVDLDRFGQAGFQEPGLEDPQAQKAYYYVDAGLIAQNVYLFAAAQGLAAWFHNCNQQELPARLKLGARQRVLFGHTIGYAKQA